MNKLPLIVKSENVPAYFDIANVVREVFRNELAADVCHKPTSLNSKVYEEHKSISRELRGVEKALMTEEAIKLLQRNKICINQNIEENEGFSYNFLNKYCIIKDSVILPPVPFGFKRSVKRNLDCQIISEVNVNPLPVVRLPKQLEIECAAIKERKRLNFLRPIVEKSKLPVLLVAEPSKVHFMAFKVGGTYKRQLKLRNVGAFGCHFNINPLPTTSPFSLEWTPLPGLTKLIAPGQYLILKVSFACQSLNNTTEKVIVYVENGKDVVVSLVACRPDPFLIVSIAEEDISSYLEFSNRDTVLSHTVECGKLLLGTESTIVLTLLNIGSDARFCIIDEERWSLMCMDILKADNTLHIDQFAIYPAYFSVKQGQVIDIYITITASNPGLFLANVYILCDNHTIEFLDILAEAFTFDSEWIQFKDMEKTFDIDIEDNMEAQWYIDLGVTLCTATVEHTFTVHNFSGIYLNYHWEIKEANIPDAKEIPQDILDISQISGQLLTKSDHSTTVSCNIKSLLPGRYRTILVLIIDNLPRKCIEIKDLKNIVDESDENLVSLKIGEIEVWLECVKPCVIINPFVLDLSTELLQCTKMEFIEFEITNNSPGSVHILLQHSECSPHAQFECVPHDFFMTKFSSEKCVVMIQPLSPGFFAQIIKCIVNSREVVLDLFVKGKCSSGYLTSDNPCLDFGIVKKYVKPFKVVQIKNYYKHEVNWTMDELEYTKDEILKKFDEKSSAVNEGCFCHEGCCVYGEYTMNKTNITGIHCSLLEWVVENDPFYIQILGDLFSTDVSLEFISYTFEKLYLDVTVLLEIKVRNHSVLPTSVCWGHPVGNQHSLFIQPEPKGAVIEARGEETFVLTMTPAKEGSLVDFFVPCFVELQTYPLLLKINGNVEGLQVVFQWCAKKEYMHVTWPQTKISTSDDFVRSSPKIATCSLSWKDSLDECTDNSFHSVQKYENLQEIEETLSPLLEFDKASIVSSEPYLNWPIIGGKYTRPTMEDSDLESDFNQIWVEDIRRQEENKIEDESSTDVLENVFDNLQALTFLAVPVKQLVSQKVYLFNETEIESSVSCRVVQFEKIDPIFPPESTVTTIQKKVYHIPEPDDWFLGTDKEKGLSITVEPITAVLPPQGSVCFTVTVYALAWGDYDDSVEIKVGKLPVFTVPIHVSCNELPISVEQTKIRFGTLFYLDEEDKSETLQVHNNSCVPIYISWQMFVNTPSQSHPFSVILVDNYITKTPFTLNLIPDRGIYCNFIFKMMKSYMTVKPWSTEALEVKFNPRNHPINMDSNNLITSFTGTIVGHVFTDLKTIGCNRSIGIEFQPVEVPIEASVQVPTISFLNLKRNDVVFKCKACEVMETKYQTLTMEKVLILGNHSQVQLDVSVSISKPFDIHSIHYHRKKNNGINRIYLAPRETCEMRVICKVTKDMLDQFFPESCNGDSTTIEAAHFECGRITFSQPGWVQEINMELWVYQPILVISQPYINFGPVLVKETKHELLYIVSTTGTEKITLEFRSGAESAFSFDQKPEAMILELINNNFVLAINFSPSDTLCYNDELIIRTCLSSGVLTVPLSGIGTWNFKDHRF